jgi:hypothetical protein
MRAAKADGEIERSNFVVAEAGQRLTALSLDETVVGLRPPIETQGRPRSGFDLDRARCDLGYLAIADQQSNAANIDPTPHRRDGEKFVVRPVEAQRLVAMTCDQKGLKPVHRDPPPIVRYVGRAPSLDLLQKRSGCVPAAFKLRPAVVAGTKQNTKCFDVILDLREDARIRFGRRASPDSPFVPFDSDSEFP